MRLSWNRNIKRIATTLAALLVIVFIIAFFQNDANRYALSNGSGNISSGQRFGIKIGDSIEVARGILTEAGFTEAFNPDELDDIRYPQHNHYIFLDQGWRRGTVWLEVSEETVTAIGWRYQFGAP